MSGGRFKTNASSYWMGQVSPIGGTFGQTVQDAETTPAAEISKNTVFDIAELKDFRIRLVNNGGMADIVELGAWKTANNGK